MDLGLNGAQLMVAASALATSVGWLVASGILYLARKPPEPPVGPRTLELGSESPAVANFLVNGFRVGDEALPATLLDLAADVSLSAHERRLLAHLERRASGGVIPAEALTTGVEAESKRGVAAAGSCAATSVLATCGAA